MDFYVNQALVAAFLMAGAHVVMLGVGRIERERHLLWVVILMTVGSLLLHLILPHKQDELSRGMSIVDLFTSLIIASGVRYLFR